MNRTLSLTFLCTTAATLCLAQTEPVLDLTAVTVYSSKVANQDPVGTFAMPISSLRYDPFVDVQARNLAEGQSDVSLRGGLFENTGFKVGAIANYDPQTGHYLAELPIAPMLLQAPEVLTGTSNALFGINANVGALKYAWRPIQQGGYLALAGGARDTYRTEIYQGLTRRLGDHSSLGIDLAYAHSESDGSLEYGDHRFDRINGRLQWVSPWGQTDLFAGYQGKFFGWPNLYTPYGVKETENLQTKLYVLNHRVQLEDQDYLEIGAYWRGNRDDYEYNRFIPGQFNPYQHASTVWGGGIEGRNRVAEDLSLRYAGQFMVDSIDSTSLTFGRFRHRDYVKLVVAPEKVWHLGDRSRFSLLVGGSYDDTNKDPSALSPLVEVAHQAEASEGGARRFYLAFGQTSQVATYTALNSNAKAGLFRGNPNLDRTRSTGIEGGFAAPLGGWSLRGAVFFRRDDDLVDWTYKTGVTARTANAMDLDTLGFEMVLSRSWRALDLIVGYTTLSKESFYGSAAVDASFYALNYARHRLTTALVARLGAGFELRLDNEARLQASNALRTTGTDKLTSALGLAYRSPSLPSLVLSAQVDNLWNTQFEEVPSVPSARRLWSVGARYGW